MKLRTNHSRRSARRRSGFTLVETVIVVGILALLAQALIDSATGMGRITSSGNTRTRLQEQGERALNALIPELRRSGFQVVDGKDYPYFFEDGFAEDEFEDHRHEPADTMAIEGDPDFGPSKEIVFVLPLDDDDDGAPDIDEASGTVLWSEDEISFTLETLDDGRNHLVRRVNGEDPESLARDVERVVFDGHVSSGLDPDIPLNAVRVQIHLRRIADDGALYLHSCEVLLRLRNIG